MIAINPETLASYLDDALSESETAQIEQALRASDALRQQLRRVMQERDRGDHSVGAIWRRHRISCPPREQLGSYLLGALDDDLHEYIGFHLQTVGCAYCLANLADLQLQQQEAAGPTQKRRRRYLQSSAGLLTPPGKKGKK
jgi:hypothetical protein